MRLNQMFPSAFYKAADLDVPQTLEIAGVDMETMRDGEVKPALSFSNSGKRLILNRVNGSVLAEAYGADSDSWTGKPVQLFATETDFGGKRVPCIRLRMPQPAKSKAEIIDPLGRLRPAKKDKDDGSLDDLDDEIPF
jgi:hypothetical protein